MSIDSRKKLTAFYDSGKVVVTSEFVNSMFGGLHGTSAGDIIASVDPNDPRIIGHLHDGTHADGHAGKIDLGKHVQGELAHVNLGDGVVRRNNIQCYPEALRENAIPEFSVDPVTGEKCYYLNIDLEDPGRPAGKDTEIQFNDDGEFGSQAGYVFKKEDIDGLRNGSMGINVQNIEQNIPYALSIYGDGQIYSDKILGNEVNLEIEYNNSTSDRNWSITGDGTFAIRKTDGIISFDSSFGRDEFISRYEDHKLIFLPNNPRYDSDGDGILDAWLIDLYSEGMETFLEDAVIKPSWIGDDGRVSLIEGITFSRREGHDRLAEHEGIVGEWVDLFNNIVAFFKLPPSRVPNIEYLSTSNLLGNDARDSVDGSRGPLDACDGSYFSPTAVGISGIPDDIDGIVDFLLWALSNRITAIGRIDISYGIKLDKYIDDYNLYGTIIGKVNVKLTNSTGRGKVSGDRWYRLDYDVKKNIGNAKVTLVASDGLVQASSQAYVASEDVQLKSDAGHHHIFFKTALCLQHVEPGGIYDGEDEVPPVFCLHFSSSSPGEIVEIANFELNEVLDGDLHISGLLTGGGGRGIRLSESGPREGGLESGLVGIGLSRSEWWKHHPPLGGEETYDNSIGEKPNAELHIRGESGRLDYDPNNPGEKAFWSTPIIVEDIPSCSWTTEVGDELSHEDIRGTIVVDNEGRFFVNEKIKCEEAGSALALPGLAGYLIFHNSGGVLGGNRAISIDHSDLINPSLTLTGTDDASNPMSFASFDFALAEDDGTGTEVTSVLSSAVASRDNLHLIGSGGSLSSGSSPFVPASGMLNIGTTSGGGYSTGLRVDSAGRVTIGDVDSLDHTLMSSILVNSSGLTAGEKYEITDNPTPLDFTQFGATNSNVGTVFISNSTIASGSTLISDPSAKVDILRGAHANRTLHVVGVGSGTPPIRIEDITLGDTDVDWGHSLMVNPAGDIYKNVGGAQFMEVTAGEDLDAGVPVSFAGFDSLNGRIIVKTDGNGTLSGSSAFTSVNDAYVGITAGASTVSQVILIQNFGLFTSANIMLSAIPSAWFLGVTIPAGTPLKTMTNNEWKSLGSPWSAFGETKWLTLDVSSVAPHPIDEASKRNRAGFLVEDWVITSGDIGSGLDPANAGIQLENAKVFIRSGW